MSTAREDEWADGWHISSNGERKALKDLPSTYLENIIKKYSQEHDVSAIKKELDSRPQQ